MSILKRPGWVNRVVITEGRLHSDDLKQRITNLFTRTSLGNSPTYVVGKIAEILRNEKGDDVDINDVTDEDIIRIAHSEEVTNGKFTPELKDGIENARQESGDEIPDVSDAGLPSDEEGVDSEEISDESESDLDSEEETPSPEDHSEDGEYSEDAEAVRKTAECDCVKNQSVNTVGKKGLDITKESAKLSNKQVDKLLKENYIKSRQHKFKVEERYRFF
jgi:hypothetical protein